MLNHEDSDVEVRLEAGATVRRGAKDVQVSNRSARLVLEKKDHFTLSYQLLDDSANLELKTQANVNKKLVNLTYTANPGANQSSLKAGVDVTDDLNAHVCYNLANFRGLDANNATLGLKYKINEETTAEMDFDVGRKANRTTVTYRLDSDNELKATAHLNLGNGSDAFDRLVLSLKNTSDVLGKGELRAEAQVSNSGTVQARLLKEWALDF